MQFFRGKEKVLAIFDSIVPFTSGIRKSTNTFEFRKNE